MNRTQKNKWLSERTLMNTKTIWEQHGFHTLTPIQEKTQELIKEGTDIVAISPTGTGKTLAYVVPILERVKADKTLQALIVAPSQELAQQIGAVIREWKTPEIRVQVLAGGANVKRQVEKLKDKPEIVVGTPGRLLELSKLRKLKLHQVEMLVLDEADYLLDPEQLNNTRELVKKLPSERQVLCFSATKNKNLEEVNKWINMLPTFVEVSEGNSAHSNVTHGYIECPTRKRDEVLRKLAFSQNANQALVFVNSIANAALLGEKLAYHQVPVALLSSDAHQTERKKAIDLFKKGQIPFLLSTDVAQRGLDIEDLPLVIHYDIADSTEQYTHRSGRTGRMGKEGLVLSLVNDRELRDLKKVAGKHKLVQFELYAGQLKPVTQPKKKEVSSKKPTQKRKKGNKNGNHRGFKKSN